MNQTKLTLDASQLPLHQFIQTIEKQISLLKPYEKISFEILNPDIVHSTYNGTIIEIENNAYIYRGYKTWLDLAQQLGCRIRTPKQISTHKLLITYEKIDLQESFHTQIAQQEEKYGATSLFAQISKNEESSFLFYYLQALKNVNISKRFRILNLGINSGDEFEIIKNYTENFQDLELIGIDFCPSAIENAKKKFYKDKNIQFYTHDINQLHTLNLEKFDLIISIGTLQSSNLNFNTTLMNIVQNYLKKTGAMILGFPNCRWIDGEMIYGAKVKNYPFSEMSLLYKDAIFSKKYLQKKKFRVTLTGKDYIFLTATSIKKV